MNERRPKFRADVRVHAVSPRVAILDTASGIELLEGHLASALPHLLKGLPREGIIDEAGRAHALEVLCELEELGDRGLLAHEDGRDDAPQIVFTADYLDPELDRVNRDALEAGKPWMLARPRGEIVWIGPLFVPGRGPCWECMAARLRAVRAAWRLPEKRADEDAAVTPVGLELAALEAARWKRQPDDRAWLRTFDTKSLVQQSHVIVRNRNCSTCGDAAVQRASAPLVLQKREKAFLVDGGHRAVPPEETYAHYGHLVSALTGVVQSVERARGDGGPLNVFAARHNYRVGDELIPLRSFGKGMTAAQARTGALCEALERYCGLAHGDEPLVRASLSALGESALHPNASLGISERQYRERDAWNRDAPQILWIPEPFDEQHETDWVAAWSLTRQCERHVPAALCYYGLRDPVNDFAHADSNGNAAGTSIEDAVLQGLLELVERDAAGIWWYGRMRRPGVTTGNSYAQAMTAEHAARGRRLWVLDITTDTGIPVCAAISMSEQPDDLLVGFGAHLDPALALTRAISEVNQLVAIRRGQRMYRAEGQPLPDWSFLEPDGFREPSTVAMPSHDLRDDVLACVEILRRLDLEVIVLDQTREEIGLPVVKVIVPGLRHFRPRFAPGRLYDVPLKLGWTEQPFGEDDLHATHLTT